MKGGWAVLAVLVALCSRADGTYVKIKQGEQKCFIEFLKKNEVVVVSYESPDQDPLPSSPELAKMHVGPELNVHGPGTPEAPHLPVHLFNGRTDMIGRFSFVSMEGEHRLCWQIHGHNFGKEFRLTVSIKSGLEDVDYAAIAKKDHLNSMELKVRQLKDEIARIQSEQIYFRNREIMSRNTADSSFQRVFWLNLMQISIMIVVTSMYLWYMRTYFMAKKLV